MIDFISHKTAEYENCVTFHEEDACGWVSALRISSPDSPSRFSFSGFFSDFQRLSPLFGLVLLDFEAPESRYSALTYETLISTDR